MRGPVVVHAHERAANPTTLDGTADSQWAAHLHRGVLLEIAVCAVPAFLAVKLAVPHLGAQWLFLSLFACMALNLVVSNPVANLALITGLIPAITLLRNLFLYNSVILLLVVGLACVLLRSPGQVRALHSAGFAAISCLATLFWFLSYVLTDSYYSNLRIFELVLGAAVVIVLAQHREHFATALFGMLLSLIAMGFAFFGYGQRLGYATVNGHLLGNPITFGEPLALLLLLINADNGKWLLLQRNPSVRLMLSTVVGVLLLLSTSRGSWLVAAGGISVILLCNRRSRKGALIALTALALAGVVASHTERGADLTTWINRTFSDDRSLSNRTSGRSDQWMLLPAVMKAAPPWGFGPGSGPEVYAHYSALDPRVRLHPGHGMAWHSLYLQLAVETGIVGLLALLILLFTTTRSSILYWMRNDEVMPMVGTLGFMLIALTVSGMDVPSGLFLGFGLLTRRHGGGTLGSIHPRAPVITTGI